MKLISLSGYVGPKKTGIGRTLENILIQLSDNSPPDFRYILFCNHDNHDFDQVTECSSNIEKKNINITRNNSLLNLLWHQFIYPILILIYKIDLAYIPNVTLLLWKICPTVVVIHDLIEFNVPNKFGRIRMLYRRFAVPLTAKRADHIITVSENSKNDIVKFFKINPRKITVIYNGVDEVFRTKEKSSITSVLRKYHINEPYFLNVGTIDHPGKNSITIIRVFKKLLIKYPNYKLILVGSPGFGYNHIEREIKNLVIEDSVFILGYVPDEDLVCLYAGATIFFFLSTYEGFGLPVVEAMACGNPVIVANTSCLPEIVGNAGIIVEPFDVEKIECLVERLISDRDFYGKMVDLGINRSNMFTWEKAGRSTMRVFRKILADYSIHDQSN